MHAVYYRACTVVNRLPTNPRVCSNILVDKLGASVKKLRSTLQESQQAFAHRLGLSVRAIANYEAGRRPSRVVLFKLGMLSAINNLVDLTSVFSSAYVVAIKGRTEPTGQERVLVRIVLSLSRHQELVRTWPRMAAELVDSLSALVDSCSELLKKARGQDRALWENLKELGETLDEARQWVREQQLESRARELSKRTKQPFFQAYLQVLRDDPACSSHYADAAAQFSAPVKAQAKARRPEALNRVREKDKGLPFDSEGSS
jgi:transcriptional regulator with XRE-family HTH domain